MISEYICIFERSSSADALPAIRRTSPSDGITSINQTNLALKGIIGIGAMARIDSFMGMNNDALMYDVRRI